MIRLELNRNFTSNSKKKKERKKFSLLKLLRKRNNTYSLTYVDRLCCASVSSRLKMFEERKINSYVSLEKLFH